MNKPTKQILGAVVGSVSLGLIFGYGFLSYGANKGCFPIIDSLMQEQGYLSCGPFGVIVGIILGAVLGVIVVRQNWKKILNR